MSELLQAGDTVNGLEGEVTVTIGNERRVIAETRSVNAHVGKTKESIKVIGRRAPISKATGYEGTGTLTVLYGSLEFTQMMLKYMNEGIDTDFDIQIRNTDQTSTRPSRTVILYGCNIDEIDISKLDADASFLEEEIPFTFERAVLL